MGRGSLEQHQQPKRLKVGHIACNAAVNRTHAWRAIRSHHLQELRLIRRDRFF